jgi:ribosomal protein S27AE
MTLPAWDQSDGVECPVCGEDMTLCEHGNDLICPDCGGSGVVEISNPKSPAQGRVSVDCPRCHASR